jgi:hypothetical protein
MLPSDVEGVDGLLLRMEGEKYQQQRQEVHLYFVCNLDVEEVSNPFL